jgi:predicted small lipoprotein YifL
MISFASLNIKVFSVLVGILSLSACGKKGTPQLPTGEIDTYSGQYPAPDNTY